jgi:uncharacterized protein YbjT (DUF2867 family)
MTIAIVGGSGLVGGLLLDRLAAQGRADVHAFLRRAVPERAGLTQHVMPSDKWPDAIAALGAALFISTLGTTIRQAGSQAAFVAVDKSLLLACAGASGARHAISVSSVGAGGGNFYLKVKGEAEAGLASLGFERLDILRPGLLLGDRSGPARPAERLGMLLAPITNLLTPSSLDRYRAIEARTVAAAIAVLADSGTAGHFIHHNREMHALAD